MFLRKDLVSHFKRLYFAHQQTPAGKKARLLQCPARGDVGGITAGRWFLAGFVTDPLHFLHQVATEALPPGGFRHVHMNVRVRRVVVAEKSSPRHNNALRFDDPLGIRIRPMVFRCGAPEETVRAGKMGNEGIVLTVIGAALSQRAWQCPPEPATHR